MSKYLTLVAVGDRDSNKTELLQKYTGGRNYSHHYESFIVPRFQNSVHSIIVDRIPRTVHFIDVEPDEDYKILRTESYKKADCILLCYSVKTKSSFKNIYKKWCLEVRKQIPHVPIVLTATGIESRNNNRSTITTEQGENLKLLIGAYAFIECSIKHFLGIDDVFIEAIRSTYNVRKNYFNN